MKKGTHSAETSKAKLKDLIPLQRPTGVASGQHTLPSDVSGFSIQNDSKDRIPGGLSSGKKFKINKTQLRKGIKVELEHTDDPDVAKEIAMDHLYEDPKYYTKLEKIEKKPKKLKNKNFDGSTSFPGSARDPSSEGDVNYEVGTSGGSPSVPSLDPDSSKDLFGGQDDIGNPNALPPANSSIQNELENLKNYFLRLGHTSNANKIEKIIKKNI